MAFEDDQITTFEKQAVMLNNLYIDKPKDIQKAFERANWFLNGGETAKGNSEKEQIRLYSFSKDANFIFAAFRQTHNVDLQEAEMHWWKFLALFMDLGKETTFSSLVALRKKYKAGRATKEEKKAIADMGDVFEINEWDDRTLEEKEMHSKFMALIEKGKQNEKTRP